MHKIAAELRHRELTQEIYNIGDEVAQYIENLIEAIEDWDADLALDCLAEIGDIVEDARVDSGRCVGELIGLRQALISGLRSGTISAAASVTMTWKHRTHSMRAHSKRIIQLMARR